MAGGELLLGIDVGTTNVKALVFDPSGRIEGQCVVATPTRSSRPGWDHYRPDELWGRVAAAVRSLCDRLGGSSRIVSVAVASMGETGVPIDARGDPTYDAIAWYDARSRPQAERLADALGRERLFRLTGLPVRPIFGLCKLLWLKEHAPEALARAARWLNVADYVAFRLCGEAATDYSLASRTLALDLRARRWDEALLDEAGIRPELLAPLVQSGAPLGRVRPEAARATGLHTGVVVAAGGHDHICGALAVGVVERGRILDSLGTAEALFVPLERPLDDPRVAEQGYEQGVHVVSDRYYVFGGLFTSGASIDWFRDLVGADDHAVLIAEAREVRAGSRGVYFLPHLRLASPPHDGGEGRAAFVGLRASTGRPVLFRAVLESLAYDARGSLETLVAHGATPDSAEIYAIGGGARNDLLMEIKASVLGRAISVVSMEEATSLGAAVLGGLGAGVYRDVASALAGLRREDRRVEPLPDDVRHYERRFRRAYVDIYPTLRPLHQTIIELEEGS